MAQNGGKVFLMCRIMSCSKGIVILSVVRSSHSELLTESKDPFDLARQQT